MLAKLTALLLVVLSPGLAGGATMQVSAEVVNNCVVNVPSSVDLPAYSGMQVRSRVEFQLRCTKGATPIVSVADGVPTPSTEGRLLIGPNGGQLAYQIYSNSAYDFVWNAVTEPPADGVTLTSYAFYWAIPAGQSVPPGLYANNLDVTVDPGTSMAKHYAIHVSSFVR